MVAEFRVAVIYGVGLAGFGCLEPKMVSEKKTPPGQQGM